METKYGNYLVKAEIGRGGFGRVFSAVDAGINRPVAIKVLTCEDDPELLSRFQAEAGITGRLTHDNIVIVYEFARQNGVPYLVMELLEGRTLQQIIASEQALPMLEKVEIMYQVAEGLQHAHAQGIIHRDIKPGNVMVLPDGRVKIMDFGIACLAQRQGSRLTREGYLVGTVPYMAPEMFGEHEPDKQTDLWAYGVLYYELLTGEHPFQAGDAYAIMKRIVNDEPVSLLSKLPSCPPALAILLQHLLIKDPEMRYEELNDVLFDMEPILRGLRQERAAALAEEIEPLLRAEKYENAYRRLKQILRLDPSHQQAQVWRDQIRSELNRQKADKLRYQGLEHMSVMRYKEAVTCFEAALQLNAYQTEIVALLDEAKAAMERLRQSAELLNYARSDRQSGKLEEALSKASRAIEIHRENREAIAMRDSLRKQIRERRIGACLQRAEVFRDQGRFDAALAALEELEPDLKAYADVKKLREQLIEERKREEQRRRNAEFRDSLKKARQLWEQGKLSEALTAAQHLCAQFPEQPLAHEFHREAQSRWEAHQRSEAIQGIVERARKLLAEANFNEARLLVTDGLACYLDAPALADFLKEIEVLAEEHVRASNIGKVLERAAILRNEGDLYRAMELAGKALTRWGSAPELEDCLRDLRLKYSEQQYALNLERTVAKGQSLLEAGQSQQALEFLGKTALQYEGEEKFNEMLDAARERVRQEEFLILEGQRQNVRSSIEAEEAPFPPSARPARSQREQRTPHPPKERLGKVVRPEIAKPDVSGRRRAGRDEAIAEGRRQATSLAQAGNLNGAIQVLEKLSRRYPNSSELRRDLEAAQKELLYRRQFEPHTERSESGWTSRMRNWIKGKGEQ
jgi:serine/threonine protein kinase